MPGKSPGRSRHRARGKDATLPQGPSLLDAFKPQASEAEALQAYERYKRFRERKDRLQKPETPWDERVALIKELEADGWASHPDWPRLRRTWQYGGQEWRMSLSPEQLDRLTELAGKGYADFLAGILREWLAAHPELKDRMLGDPDSVHFFSWWVACQVWGFKDPGVTTWLMDEIVEKSLPRHGPINDDTKEAALIRARQTRDDASDKLAEIILDRVRCITIGLAEYWRTSVRNYFRTQRRTPMVHESLRCPTCDGTGGVPPFVCPQCGMAVPRGVVGEPRDVLVPENLENSRLEDIAELTATADVIDQLVGAGHITRRARAVLLLIAADRTREDVATALGVSVSTVDLDLLKARQAVTESGARHY